MYNHQQLCATKIFELENQQNGRPFDYVISTREDVIFLSKMLLQPLLDSGHNCDVFAKGCLHWGGINMRLQVYRRKPGLDMLLNRIHYYSVLYSRGSSKKNPEQFESFMAYDLGLNVCQRPPNAVPVAVARHTKNGSYCTITKELLGCVPDNATPTFVCT